MTPLELFLIDTDPLGHGKPVTVSQYDLRVLVQESINEAREDTECEDCEGFEEDIATLEREARDSEYEQDRTNKALRLAEDELADQVGYIDELTDKLEKYEIENDDLKEKLENAA